MLPYRPMPLMILNRAISVTKVGASNGPDALQLVEERFPNITTRVFHLGFTIFPTNFCTCSVGKTILFRCPAVLHISEQDAQIVPTAIENAIHINLIAIDTIKGKVVPSHENAMVTLCIRCSRCSRNILKF